MKKAVLVAPTIFEYSDPHNLLELAKDTEEAGWEGFFICDHLLLDPDGQLGLADPSIMLGAIAAITDKVIIGSMVTPVSRRRPWKLAKEFASLDQLSNGRLRIGVGLGGLDQEFSNFGENPDKKVLAKKTDEGLAIMEKLHTGEAVNFDGEIYHITNARLLPRPVQRPRIPVWVAAMLPLKAGQRRAARWDGIMPHVMPANLDETQDISDVDMRVLMSPSPDQIRGVIEFTSELRDTDDPFDVVASGITHGMPIEDISSKLQSYQDAGATWWLEWLNCGQPGTLEQVREQIRAGPPGT
jgi:alkanesulfonate monooxygenase SsuD/methylene tetrahydromethanopterin reductase-like flavin-dependent oxidoreductase (luciferase family)